METDPRRETWQNLLHGWGVAPLQADRAFETLVQAYSAPGRLYHTLDHVLEVLATVENLASPSITLTHVLVGTILVSRTPAA